MSQPCMTWYTRIAASLPELRLHERQLSLHRRQLKNVLRQLAFLSCLKTSLSCLLCSLSCLLCRLSNINWLLHTTFAGCLICSTNFVIGSGVCSPVNRYCSSRDMRSDLYVSSCISKSCLMASCKLRHSCFLCSSLLRLSLLHPFKFKLCRASVNTLVTLKGGLNESWCGHVTPMCNLMHQDCSESLAV